jgi:uncharacterized protein YbjT (DUF2867 family)
MRIAVLGGTGTIGRRIVAVLAAQGHDARPLSRHSAPYPVDLITGAGLDAALEGCDVVVEGGGLPWSIVRATQFHDLIGALLSAADRYHVLPAAAALLQPVDVEEAAGAVAAVAAGEPRRTRTSVAGPEVLALRRLARIWRDQTRRRVLELPVPLPGRAGRALREGRLTCPEPDVRGTKTFATWLRDSVS